MSNHLSNLNRRNFIRKAGYLTASSVAAPMVPVLNQMAQAAEPGKPDAENRLIRIALISDTHTTRGVENEQPLHRPHFERVIEQVNAATVDLILFGGDLTENGTEIENGDFREQSRALQAPQFWVAGNHDVGGKHIVNADGTSKGGVTDKRLEHFEAEYGPSFWMREAGGLRIVAINASLLGSDLAREAQQWGFLEASLARPSAAPTLLLTHYPPFLKDKDEPSDYWNIDPKPRARLLPLVDSGGVRAMLSGHLHYPILARHNEVEFITAPAVSFGLPRDRQAVGWVLLTVSPQGKVQAELRTL